jgi:hypothetical protein
MTYPARGRDTNSSLGTFNSTTLVRGGSYPALTRRRSIAQDTLDRV